MAGTAYLKRNGVERFSQATNDYRELGSIAGRYKYAGCSGLAAEGGTWTVEFSAGTTVCPTCGKAIAAPGTITCAIGM